MLSEAFDCDKFTSSGLPSTEIDFSEGSFAYDLDRFKISSRYGCPPSVIPVPTAA